jgi:hypothetical protein
MCALLLACVVSGLLCLGPGDQVNSNKHRSVHLNLYGRKYLKVKKFKCPRKWQQGTEMVTRSPKRVVAASTDSWSEQRSRVSTQGRPVYEDCSAGVKRPKTAQKRPAAAG